MTWPCTGTPLAATRLRLVVLVPELVVEGLLLAV